MSTSIETVIAEREEAISRALAAESELATLRARGSSTPEQPDGLSTALVAVKAEEDLGLVRVQLSLDAPSYLLPASQARNLGALLTEAVERIKHHD